MKKCSSCRKPLPEDCKTLTCDACKQRSVTQRKNNKKNKIVCRATKQSGEKCTNKVSPKL